MKPLPTPLRLVRGENRPHLWQRGRGGTTNQLFNPTFYRPDNSNIFSSASLNTGSFDPPAYTPAANLPHEDPNTAPNFPGSILISKLISALGDLIAVISGDQAYLHYERGS